MQDARKEFLSASYNTATGIQGYYDILMDHAQNMVIYSDDYQVMERFLSGIPDDIWDKVFECGLSPEVNMIDDLVACAKAIEISKKTVAHYRKKMPIAPSPTTKLIPCCTTTDTRPRQGTYPHCPQFEYKSRDDDPRRHHYQPIDGNVRGDAPRAYERERPNDIPKNRYPPNTPDDQHKPPQPT